MMKKLIFTFSFLLFSCLSFQSWGQIIFSEDWTSSSFATNGWTFPSGQGNWQGWAAYTPTGATAPNAFFNWAPTLTNYTNELVSPIINATAYTGGSVFLSYKLHLNNFGTTTVEFFDVEYKTVSSPSWFLLTSYSSAGVVGTLNWSPTNVVLPAMAGQNFQIRFRPHGPNSFWINGWGLDDIQVLALNPCTGTPVAGTATALPNAPCPGVPVTLDLTGSTLAGGLAYQWQRSTIGPTGPWTNIGTTNPLIYYPPAGSTSWYRCIVTCNSSGLTATSLTSGAVAVQPYSPTSPCYCTPTNTGTACITNVTFGSLNNTTPGCTGTNNYNFYLTPVANFVQGNPYTFSMTTDVNPAITSVWIDYNHNTVFEPSEWYQPYTNATSGSLTITIPPTSLVGQTRMRVRSRLTGNQNGSADACLAMGSGETEDYIINISPAGPYDPTIGSITAPIGNTCTDSFQTLSAQVYNFGSTSINTTSNPISVTFTVTGPTGTNTYTSTTPTGSSLPLLPGFGGNFLTFTVSPINMFNGGVYSINAVVNCPTLTNASVSNDSLANAIMITNYRPTAGPAYNLCQYNNIPFSQGLSVGGCSAPIYDSVEITFNLTTCIDNVGAVSAGTTLGPGNANCNNTYAGNFGNVVLPTLPVGSYFTQKAKLTVDHLASNYPTEIRFILYTGSPTGTTLWAGCPTGYPGPIGDTTQIGVSSATGFGSTNFSNTRLITPGQLSNMFDPALNPGGNINLGYWESYNDLITASDITSLNSGGTTTAKLKIYYQYVPPAFAWFDVPSGGTSLYSLSPFDPLSYTNAVVNNSNVPGTYTFYAACLGLTNCRVPVDLLINPTPAAYQDTLHQCEFAVSANNGIFNLPSADATVSGNNLAASVAYFGDQALLSAIPTPATDTSSTNYIYSKVFYPSTGCFSSDTVYLDVSPIPQFTQPVYSGFACAPNAIDISSLITIISPSPIDSIFYDDQSYTGLHPNPHAIYSVDTVYMVVKTSTGVVCSDTSTAYIDIIPASNNIASQNTSGNYSMPGPIPCGTITLTNGNTETLYTTNDCRKVAKVTDSPLDLIDLGNVTICEDVYNGVPTHVSTSSNPQPYVNRSYEITPTTNGKATVCLYYLDQDFADYDAYASLSTPTWPSITPGSNLVITQVDNGDLNTPGHTAITIPNSSITSSYDPSTTVWTVCFPVDSFSFFYAHTANPFNIPLPVSLLSFTGKAVDGSSHLNWTTSSEQNNSHFILERSSDAKNFRAISSKINSKALNGNSQVKLDYSYEDKTPLNGHNHYRLQQVDIDGHVSNSGTVDVYFGDETMVTLYPNPVNTELNIDINTPKATMAYVKIMDATGRVVRMVETSLQAGSNTTKVDLQSLTDGMYMVQITNNKGLNYTQAIRKK